MSPTLRSAVGSDVGRRRPMNQDSATTTPRLLAVADGMGGHAHGEVASAVAIGALLDLDARLSGADLEQVDLLGELGITIGDAAARLTTLAQQDPDLRGTGTTVVAFLVSGLRIGVAHIGDSRAYLLRDDELHRLTRDHTHGAGDGRRGSAVRGGGGRASAAVLAGAHVAGGHAGRAGPVPARGPASVTAT